MKTNNKILILALALVVILAMPFLQKFFMAQISNVSIYVPGAPEQGGQGGGGNSYVPIVTAPTIPPVAEQPNLPIVKQPEVAIHPAKNPVLPKQNPPTQASLLPLALASLSQKIPALATIISNLNIKTANDVASLQNYNIFLPKADLSQADKIPQDIVFVLLGNKNINAQTKLNFAENAESLQQVNVLVNKKMHLVLRPSTPVKNVFGYVAFSSPNFSVTKFDYTNENNSGVFTADILAPAVAVKYQIITLVNNGEKTNQITTTTLVDPDGYIYQKVGDKELRINNAIVSLYKLNSQNQYELWNAKDYGQENPQITDATGNYSFLVPAGTYYLTISAPGYNFYQRNAISVQEGKEIHSNIELAKQFSWMSVINWNTILIAILFVLVGLNFFVLTRKKHRL